METEPLYEKAEEESLKEIQNQDLLADLDKYCAAMVSAESVEELISAHQTAANTWLKNVVFPVKSFEHDHELIMSILNSISHRRMINIQLRSLKPEIRETTERFCMAINSENSADLIDIIMAEANTWADTVTEGDDLASSIIKSALDMVRSHKLVALITARIRERESSAVRRSSDAIKNNPSLGDGGEEKPV